MGEEPADDEGDAEVGEIVGRADLLAIVGLGFLEVAARPFGIAGEETEIDVFPVEDIFLVVGHVLEKILYLSKGLDRLFQLILIELMEIEIDQSLNLVERVVILEGRKEEIVSCEFPQLIDGDHVVGLPVVRPAGLDDVEHIVGVVLAERHKLIERNDKAIENGRKTGRPGDRVGAEESKEADAQGKKDGFQDKSSDEDQSRISVEIVIDGGEVETDVQKGSGIKAESQLRLASFCDDADKPHVDDAIAGDAGKKDLAEIVDEEGHQDADEHGNEDVGITVEPGERRCKISLHKKDTDQIGEIDDEERPRRIHIQKRLFRLRGAIVFSHGTPPNNTRWYYTTSHPQLEAFFRLVDLFFGNNEGQFFKTMIDGEERKPIFQCRNGRVDIFDPRKKDLLCHAEYLCL